MSATRIRKTITSEEREQLAELIEEARILNRAQERIVRLAEDITRDWGMNSHTFDICNNSEGDVGTLLQRLGVKVNG